MFKTSKSATSNQHQLKSCPRFFLEKPTTPIVLTLLLTSIIQFSVTSERAYGQTDRKGEVGQLVKRFNEPSKGEGQAGAEARVRPLRSIKPDILERVKLFDDPSKNSPSTSTAAVPNQQAGSSQAKTSTPPNTEKAPAAAAASKDGSGSGTGNTSTSTALVPYQKTGNSAASAAERRQQLAIENGPATATTVPATPSKVGSGSGTGNTSTSTALVLFKQPGNGSAAASKVNSGAGNPPNSTALVPISNSTLPSSPDDKARNAALGLDPNGRYTKDQIDAQVRKLLKEKHPDKLSQPATTEQRAAANENLQRALSIKNGNFNNQNSGSSPKQLTIENGPTPPSKSSPGLGAGNAGPLYGDAKGDLTVRDRINMRNDAAASGSVKSPIDHLETKPPAAAPTTTTPTTTAPATTAPATTAPKLDEATRRDDAKSRPSNGQNSSPAAGNLASPSTLSHGGPESRAAESSGSGGAQNNYSNNNTLNPRSRDSCSYSATIDGRWSCDSAMQEIDSNNQRSQMTMMMGTMMTQSLGSAAQATAAGAKDQATILKAAAGTQASTAAMQGIIAMQNLYGAHQLGKQATERDLNIARLKSVDPTKLNTVDLGSANGRAVMNGTLEDKDAGFISTKNETAQKIIDNFQLNSHVTMSQAKQGDSASNEIRKQEIEEHKKATGENLKLVSEEAIQEQTRIKRQLNGAKMMQYMMGFQQAATAAASGMAAKQLFDAANKKPEVRGAGPVVIADSGRSGDGTPGTGSGRGPSAISGGGEGQNAADADTNSDAPPSDLGTPFAPVPGGNELADQPPPPQEKPGGQGGGNGGGGGDSGGLSASTSPASEGGDQGPGDAKMAAASTDLTYSGGGGGYSGGGGGGGGGGDAGIDLNSLLGQLLPQKDGADGGTDSNGILSFSGKDAMQPYSPLSANTNIFTKISEKYAELNKAGAVK